MADVLFEPVVAGDAGWVARVAARRAQNEPFVLATVLAPEGVEKHLLPDADAGVALSERADGLLGEPGASVRHDSVQTASGVHVPALFECIGRPGPEIVVFGAGHVGRALLGVLLPLATPLRWIDSRDDVFPDGIAAHVTCVHATAPETQVAQLEPGATVLVMTHSHPQDLAICAEALRRDDLAFCGLIGSVSKRRQFERRLRQAGLDERHLARLTCPIGIDGIPGKQPAEIAIAVAAQVLQLRAAGGAAQAHADNAKARR